MTAYANEIPATVYAEAHALGIAAGNACSPTPMVVGTPTTPLGDDIDYSKDTYYVSDGVCGFAWVNIKPARGGFVKFLKDNKIGRKDSYYGGTLCGFLISVSHLREKNHMRGPLRIT